MRYAFGSYVQKLWLLCGASCSSGKELLSKETLVGNVSAVYRNKYVLETFLCKIFYEDYVVAVYTEKMLFWNLFDRDLEYLYG